MAQDKYRPQLRLIKGGKLKIDDAPEEYAALCGELAGCLLEFVQHEVGIAEFSRKRKAITEKMEEFENTLAAEAEVEELEPPTFASDEEEAEWYRKRAERGNPFAQNHLGDMYYEGRGVTVDYYQAEEWWNKAAEGYRIRAKQGDAEAQYRLGALYETGNGVPKDEKKAVEWYRKSAEQGHADAQYGLGCMYYNGLGVRTRYQPAEEWYIKAAEQGHVDAQYRLGEMYWGGCGVVQRNRRLANEWYSKAAEGYRLRAEKGDVEVWCRLGWMYNRGLGVPQDQNQAEVWFGKVADAYRERVEQDDARALLELRLLAESGWSNAQYHWGTLAETGGGGVHQNIMHATAWYRKAAKQGHTEAKEALERLNS